MADKNIQMKKKKSDGTFDDYFPITKNENVLGGRVVTGNISIPDGNFTRTITLGFRPKFVKVYYLLEGTFMLAFDVIDGSTGVMHANGHGKIPASHSITFSSTGFTIKGVVASSSVISYIAIG